MRVSENAPIQQLVQDAELEVSRQFGVQRSRGHAFVLESSKPRRESGEGGVTEFSKRLLESCIDRMRLSKHDACGIPTSSKELQPASKARFENGSRALWPRGSGRRIERFERLFGSIAKIIEHSQEHPLLAVEIQVEGPAGDPSATDDVRDTRAPVSLSRKDPRRSVQQLLPSDVGRKDGPMTADLS